MGIRKLTNFFLVLDIETSTEYGEDGLPINTWLSYGYCSLYNTNAETLQSCYFREWHTLKTFFQQIQLTYAGYDITCYAHNLAFEFDFLIKNIGNGYEILANSSHSIISGRIKGVPNIIFKCSYQLTGVSLKRLGELICFPKLESEYRTIYPTDNVTEEEKEYCKRDIDIVARYICEVFLPKYGSLKNIPLTKTGVVRQKLREFNKQNGVSEWDINPPEECYPAMLKSFRGGITITNPMFTNRFLKNVHCYDITSSYPYVMLKNVFPVKIRKTLINNVEAMNIYPFWIARIRIFNIKSKYQWQWLSYSTCIDYSPNTLLFNGKIVESEYIDLYLCNVDFENIKNTYTYDFIEIEEFYECSRVSRIAPPVRKTLEHYATHKYECKKEYKKNPCLETEREYALSKGDFNSIYGMMVQKLTNNKFEIDINSEWTEIGEPYHFKKNRHLCKNFLYGIYITAYARYNLLTAIVTNCPHTFVYADTDSIKFIGSNDFEDTNTPLTEYSNVEALAPLGTFDYEGDYEMFITLGAKKYAHVNNGICSMTVAGLPKTQQINDIFKFKLNTDFKNCKLGKKYLINDNQSLGVGGVALYPTNYLLNMTTSDLLYIENEQKMFKDFVQLYKLGDYIYEK